LTGGMDKDSSSPASPASSKDRDWHLDFVDFSGL